MIGALSSEKEMSDINVTPFIDVMLVLLIIFMVVTPLITSSVHVNLPSASAEAEPDQGVPNVIYIDANYDIYVGDVKVDSANIVQVLDERTKSDKSKVIYFYVDKSVPYERLVATVQLIKAANYQKIALSTAMKE